MSYSFRIIACINELLCFHNDFASFIICRPFRLPVILVGDGRLGGISGTISAYETLKLRGYDVVAVVIEDCGLGNDGPLLSYLQNR